jgi:hypothetical protein
VRVHGRHLRGGAAAVRCAATANFHPVCGCNSKTYSSDCFRRAYRVGKLKDGKC